MANISTGNQRQLIAFVHIEKAAGTTLIHILRRNFFLRYFDVRPLSENSNGMFSMSDLNKALRINPFTKCIGGHAITTYQDLSAGYHDIRYITVLREPTARYISQYRQFTEVKKRNIKFEDFLKTEGVSNFQTKKIAGSDNIERAKEIVSKDFLLVGMVEKFDEFLVLLRNKLSKYKIKPYYQKKNVANQEEKSSEISQRYRDLILEKNSSDLELYDYVKTSVMPTQIADYGDEFEQDVAYFKAHNKLNWRDMIKSDLDYLWRVAYIEPITGAIRRWNKLPAHGSYGTFYHPDQQPW